MQSSDPEIDVTELLRVLWQTLVRRKLWIAVAMLLGAGASWLHIHRHPERYNSHFRSEFMIKSNLLVPEELFALAGGIQSTTHLSTAKGEINFVVRKDLSADGQRVTAHIIALSENELNVPEIQMLVQSNFGSSDLFRQRTAEGIRTVAVLSMQIDSVLKGEVDTLLLSTLIGERAKQQARLVGPQDDLVLVPVGEVNFRIETLTLKLQILFAFSIMFAAIALLVLFPYKALFAGNVSQQG